MACNMINAAEITLWLFFFFVFLCGLCKGADVYNLDCYNDYLEEMVCTWEADREINCTAEYTLLCERLNDPVLSITCIPNNLRTDNSVLPTHCDCKISIPFLFVAADVYEIQLKSGDDVLLNSTIYPSYSIKPKPPENLTVSKSVNEDYELKWNSYYLNSLLVDYLKFQVSYRKKQDPEEDSIECEVSDGMSFKILRNKLVPGYDYVAKVRAMPKDYYSGQWSEWTPYVEWTNAYKIAFKDILEIIVPVICIVLLAQICICYLCITKLKRMWWEKIPNPFNSQVAKMKLPSCNFNVPFIPESEKYIYELQPKDNLQFNCIINEHIKLSCSLDSNDLKPTSKENEIPFHGNVFSFLSNPQNRLNDQFSPKPSVFSQLILSQDPLFGSGFEDPFFDQPTQFKSSKEQLGAICPVLPMSSLEDKCYSLTVLSYTLNHPITSFKDWGCPKLASTDLLEFDYKNFKNMSKNFCTWTDISTSEKIAENQPFPQAVHDFVRPVMETKEDLILVSDGYKAFESCVVESLLNTSSNESRQMEAEHAQQLSEGSCSFLSESQMDNTKQISSKDRMQSPDSCECGYQSFNKIVSQSWERENTEDMVHKTFFHDVGVPESPLTSQDTAHDRLIANGNAAFNCKPGQSFNDVITYSTNKEGKLTEYEDGPLQSIEMQNPPRQVFGTPGLEQSTDKFQSGASGLASSLFEHLTAKKWTFQSCPSQCNGATVSNSSEELNRFIPDFGHGESSGTNSTCVITQTDYQSFSNLVNPTEVQVGNTHCMMNLYATDAAGSSKSAHENFVQLLTSDFKELPTDNFTKSDIEAKRSGRSGSAEDNVDIFLEVPDMLVSSGHLAVGNSLSNTPTDLDKKTNLKYGSIPGSKEVEYQSFNSLVIYGSTEIPADNTEIRAETPSSVVLAVDGYQSFDSAVCAGQVECASEDYTAKPKQKLISPVSLSMFKISGYSKDPEKAHENSQLTNNASDLESNSQSDFNKLSQNPQTSVSDQLEDSTNLKAQQVPEIMETTMQSPHFDNTPSQDCCSVSSQQCPVKSDCNDLQSKSDQNDGCENMCFLEHSDMHVTEETASSPFLMVPIEETTDDDDDDDDDEEEEVYMKVTVMNRQNDEDKYLKHKKMDVKHKKHFVRNLPLKQWIFN